MAAITGATLSSSVTEGINSEFIDRILSQPNRPMPVWTSLAELVLNPGGNWNSAVYTRPKIVAAATANSFGSAKSETDEFVAQEQTLTEVQGTAATMGTRKAYPDEAAQDTVFALAATLLFQSDAEVDQQVDVDLLSLFGSITANEDNTGVAMSVAHIDSGIAQLRAANPNGDNLVFVGHSANMAQLKTDIKAQTGSTMAGALGDQSAGLFNARARGFLGRWQGVEFIESNNVTQEDSSNWSNALFIAGAGGAFLMPIWWMPKSEADREIRRLAVDLVTSMRYTQIINEQLHAVQFINLK